MNKITVNENKAKIIQGQISTLQDLIIITGKTSPEQIKAENQKILITSHIKSLQRVLDEFFDRTAQKIIDFDKYNKDAITKLQQELMKQNEVDRELSKNSSVAIQLPTIRGLQIPEGLYCDDTPQTYIDCYYSDWEKTGDTDHFYCELYGLDRGKCIKVDKNGKINANGSLSLNNLEDQICKGDPKSPKQVNCIDYEKASTRTCKIENLSTCTEKWISHNPGIFKTCQKKLFDYGCYNETKTLYRKCTTYSKKYWSCKAYAYDPKTKKYDLKVYKAYLRSYDEEYDVSKTVSNGTEKSLSYDNEYNISFE